MKTLTNTIPDHVRVIMYAVADRMITDENGSYLPYGISTRNLKGFQIDVMKPQSHNPFVFTLWVDGKDINVVAYYDTLEALQAGITYATTRTRLNAFLARSIAELQATVSKLSTIAMNIQ